LIRPGLLLILESLAKIQRFKRLPQRAHEFAFKHGLDLYIFESWSGRAAMWGCRKKKQKTFFDPLYNNLKS
jgi:hypothetical protein